MRLLDSGKNLLLRKFVPVLAVTVLGTTPFIHLPQVLAIMKTAGEAKEYRKQAMSVPMQRPSEAEVRGWQAAVPAADLMEPPRFMVDLRTLARQSGCTLGATNDAAPAAVEGQDDLSSIDSTVKVSGNYRALVRFTSALRREPRVLAVTRTNLTTEKYPQLEADLTIRRFLRRSSDGAAIQ